MKRRQTRRILRAALVPAGLLALAVGVALFLHPPCLILSLTGLTCPGCGAQRMIAALFRGDVGAAFHHNPFLFALSPFLLAYGAWEAVRYVREKPPLIRRRAVQAAFGAVAAAALVFMALRNLPGFEFLGP